MVRRKRKQNRMAKFSITCMVFLLIALMSTQIVKYEEQKLEEEARQKELEEKEKNMQSQDDMEKEAHRYGLFYDDEIIYREEK